MHEIRYSKEFSKDYSKLKESKEKGQGEAAYLLKLIGKATLTLLQDKEAGKKIPRKKWPKKYLKDYEITNLWKFNLDTYWRLTYTITGNQINLFLIYLEYMGHKAYDRRFGYKKR